jgi:hypothetical protein
MVPWLQDFDLFWLIERKEDQETWLEQRKLIPYLHHLLQTCNSRPLCFQEEEMVLHDPR